MLTRALYEPSRLAFVAALLVLGYGCDGNHVLGTADSGAPGEMPPNTSEAGVELGAGAAATSGGTGVGTGNAGSTATGAAGADGSVGGAGSIGTAGAAGAIADPGTLGPAQSWTGYVENYKFPSGSDALTLSFGTDANGIVKGTMVFGHGTPPAPATDPNIGYPPEFEAASSGTLGPQYIAEGVAYTFDGGTLSGHRLQFAINVAQLWAGWCALQPAPTDGSRSCVPNWGGMYTPTMGCSQTNPRTGEVVKVDCGKYVLCLSGTTCLCTAAGCGVSPSGEDEVFDLFIDGNTASGSTQAPFGQENVHFVKD